MAFNNFGWKQPDANKVLKAMKGHNVAKNYGVLKPTKVMFGVSSQKAKPKPKPWKPSGPTSNGYRVGP